MTIRKVKRKIENLIFNVSDSQSSNGRDKDRFIEACAKNTEISHQLKSMCDMDQKQSFRPFGGPAKFSKAHEAQRSETKSSYPQFRLSWPNFKKYHLVPYSNTSSSLIRRYDSTSMTTDPKSESDRRQRNHKQPASNLLSLKPKHSSYLLALISFISLATLLAPTPIQAIEDSPAQAAAGGSTGASSSGTRNQPASLSSAILGSILESAESASLTSSGAPADGLTGPNKSLSSSSAGSSSPSSIVASLSSAVASVAAAAAVSAAQSSDARSIRGDSASGKSETPRKLNSASARSSQKSHSSLNHLARRLADAIPEVPYNILHNMKQLDHAAPFHGSANLYNAPVSAKLSIGGISPASGGVRKEGSSMVGPSSSSGVSMSPALSLLTNIISAASANDQFGSMFRSPFWKRIAEGYGEFASEFRSIFKPSGSPTTMKGPASSIAGSLKASKLLRDISVPALLMLVATALPNEVSCHPSPSILSSALITNHRLATFLSQWRPARTRRKSLLPSSADTSAPNHASSLANSILGTGESSGTSGSDSSSPQTFGLMQDLRLSAQPTDQSNPFALSSTAGNGNNQVSSLMDQFQFPPSLASLPGPMSAMRRIGELSPSNFSPHTKASLDDFMEAAALATDDGGSPDSVSSQMLLRSEKASTGDTKPVRSSMPKSSASSLTSSPWLSNGESLLDFVGQAGGMRDANALPPSQRRIGAFPASRVDEISLSQYHRSPSMYFERRHLQSDDKHKYSLVSPDYEGHDLRSSQPFPLANTVDRSASTTRIDSINLNEHQQPQARQQDAKLLTKSLAPSILSAVSQLMSNQARPPQSNGLTESGYSPFSSQVARSRLMNLGDNPTNNLALPFPLWNTPQSLPIPLPLTQGQANQQQQQPQSQIQQPNSNGNQATQEQRDLTQLVPQTWKEAVKKTITNVQNSATSQWRSLEGQITNWYHDKFKSNGSSTPAPALATTPVNTPSPNAGSVSNFFSGIGSAAANMIGLGQKSPINTSQSTPQSQKSASNEAPKQAAKPTMASMILQTLTGASQKSTPAPSSSPIPVLNAISHEFPASHLTNAA